MDAFRSRRWLPTVPTHLDCTNAQLLLIGERALCDEDVESHDATDELEMKLEEEDHDLELSQLDLQGANS
jgi:hypothetical protein